MLFSLVIYKGPWPHFVPLGMYAFTKLLKVNGLIENVITMLK